MQIRLEAPDQPEVAALIAELDAYQTALYPAESNHLLDMRALCRPEVLFAVVRDAGKAVVGCGAIALAGCAGVQVQAVGTDGPRSAYNLMVFNPSAQEIRDVVLAAFPKAEIGFEVDTKRQAIVDSWPADVDDSAARHDWGFDPRYDFERAFSEYLMPNIRGRYAR